MLRTHKMCLDGKIAVKETTVKAADDAKMIAEQIEKMK